MFCSIKPCLIVESFESFEYIAVVALIKNIQPSLEGVSPCFTLTSTVCVCCGVKLLLIPGYDDDSQEVFKQKEYFMYSVFNKVLQSDLGKTIVRKYAPTLDAQSVLRDFKTHMSTTSKGINERHRLHAYVSTTVYDRSWKGTTEQFILHFQFRQLDELSPLKEQLPHSVRLTLLQTAVRSVPELRNVETMEESMSLTHSSSGHFSIAYDKYFMMLQNVCIRYDKL